MAAMRHLLSFKHSLLHLKHIYNVLNDKKSLSLTP